MQYGEQQRPRCQIICCDALLSICMSCQMHNRGAVTHFLQSMTRLLPSTRRNWVALTEVGAASNLPAKGCPLSHFSLQDRYNSSIVLHQHNPSGWLKSICRACAGLIAIVQIFREVSQ